MLTKLAKAGDAMDASMQTIRLEKLEKAYKLGDVELKVLNGINLEIKKGEKVAIMGPSGSGKSTILHIAGCLDRPTSGKVFVDKKDVSKLSDNELARIRRDKIGFVFQFFYLIPSLTALGNVMLPMIFSGKQNRKKAEKLLDDVGLSERKDHLPAQLSGGERQRVAIARAMANDPAVIMADEPTGNLDSKSGKEIIDYLIKLNKEKEMTLIIVTHDKSIASNADRIIYLKDGKIIREEKKVLR
jgi:putative ABC transport system ATP-binding protein